MLISSRATFRCNLACGRRGTKDLWQIRKLNLIYHDLATKTNGNIGSFSLKTKSTAGEGYQPMASLLQQAPGCQQSQQYEFYFCETTGPAIEARIVTDRSTSSPNGAGYLDSMTWFSGAGSGLPIAVTHDIITWTFAPLLPPPAPLPPSYHDQP
ncbi:hypothetical protein SNOG_12515 [Parastagonospora nodorum SN15]|uniref:Uncharacterized protein n=1 Tax=Phaeosphaeria nodorum (strain SN15 / ATCC MYA-4574 / FGSC 10173) TaxID=321614 RepID=Q0U6U9_PHANO|nr:hypothetical protein SNOG_12515 [Parastagonospora nodorum SN15]EAT80328.1 hypothetical protein SNOG_12515 [Parastagonospora nodorum SN15]